MTNTPAPATIAVLGLGAMGAAIAGAAARAGHRVRAWNRTPRTAADLRRVGLDGRTGLDVRPTLADAVADAALVVVCVRDHDVAQSVLTGAAGALRDRLVVNVSTGTPAQAVATAAHAAGLGARYVTGAVMVPTPMVGTDACVTLYAGDAADLADLTPLTTSLGGVTDLTGPDHAVPPALDLAMLDVYFTGLHAHLHATALAAAHGIDPDRFLPYARSIVQTLDASLPGLTAAVRRRTYDTGEARLDMCRDFLAHIVASSREAGLPAGPAGVTLDVSDRALERWPGSTDWDVVAEELLPARPVGPTQCPV